MAVDDRPASWVAHVTSVSALKLNWLRDHAIPVFSDDTARASAIAAPDDGMCWYLATGGVDEGLYTFNTNGDIRPVSWNTAWGKLAGSTTTTAVSTSGTTQTLLKTSASFTAVTGRVYEVWCNTTLNQSVGTDVFDVKLRLNSTVGSTIRTARFSASDQFGFVLVGEFTAAGSTTVVLTGTRLTGTGILTTLATLDHSFLIKDVGADTGP